MNLIKNKYANLEKQINNEPIKKAITFDELYDVAISIANKGDVPTLKMLKQVYKAYSVQNAEIAAAFMQILQNSMNKENGDIPAFICIDAKAKNIIENCYYKMIKNAQTSTQYKIDSYVKENKTLEDFDENKPETFFDRK